MMLVLIFGVAICAAVTYMSIRHDKFGPALLAGLAAGTLFFFVAFFVMEKHPSAMLPTVAPPALSPTVAPAQPGLPTVAPAQPASLS
ncbi:hypothetical protein R2B67_35835 [Streptomyces cyaneofuscatus]|uniref:hypothetical protein n=1 Tax=Streptomyces cyaneofuscatus TaxID=66883 RepID=UPI002955D64B|nr:hypothetical protein [Streptomyces cyaneofuscatus]WOP13585.1 hypothetical protein R2B67_35835 [Streptomyces cyaneofuscatus]